MTQPFDIAAQRYAYERYCAAYAGAARNPVDLVRERPFEQFQPEARDRRPTAESRDPCRFCDIRGDIGCAHQRPFQPPHFDSTKSMKSEPRHHFYLSKSVDPGAFARSPVPLPPIGATTGLERQMRQFIAQHSLSQTAFAHAVGQSSNWRSGLFAKAREGRLRPATIKKVLEFMSSYGEASRRHG